MIPSFRIFLAQSRYSISTCWAEKCICDESTAFGRQRQYKVGCSKVCVGWLHTKPRLICEERKMNQLTIMLKFTLLLQLVIALRRAFWLNYCQLIDENVCFSKGIFESLKSCVSHQETYFSQHFHLLKGSNQWMNFVFKELPLGSRNLCIIHKLANDFSASAALLT